MAVAGAIRIDTTRLDEIIAKAPSRSAEIVKSAAFAVEGKAAALAPVDTGALKNSIMARAVWNLLWQISSPMEYAIYQELGFHHWKSGAFIQNPFLIPALEWVRPQFEAQWKELTK